MTEKEQANLIKYGESIDILVTPVIIDGKRGVHYTKNATTDAQRAHNDLLSLSLQICA